MNIEELKQKLDEAKYIYDDTLATVLYVALQLGRPLLIEGAAGVGKTEIAKVMAAALDRDLVRLQCYEGLDESKALYEWNYQKQLLSIQINMGSKDSDEVFANPPYYSPSTTKQPETNVTPNKAYSDQDILAYRDEYCNACESIDYITLARNPDKYKGNLYKITGKVIQVMEANGGAFVRMDVTKGEYGYWTDTIASAIRIPKGSDRILEDDIITIYGECYGLYTYETVLGSEMSIPRIDAMFYELITEP